VVDFQENGVPARRCFAQLAGAGLDARAIELVNLGGSRTKLARSLMSSPG